MITHTTAFVTPVVEQWLEREVSQWNFLCRSISNDISIVLSCLINQSSFYTLLVSSGVSLNIHSFIISFFLSFIHSFIRSCVLSFFLSFIHSFIRSFVRSFFLSFIHSSFIHSFIHSFIRFGPEIKLYVQLAHRDTSRSNRTG